MELRAASHLPVVSQSGTAVRDGRCAEHTHSFVARHGATDSPAANHPKSKRAARERNVPTESCAPPRSRCRIWGVSPSTWVGRARELLRSQAGARLERPTRAARAVELAELLVELSRRLTRPEERRRARMLARLMEDAPGQLLTTALTDRVYRSRRPARVLDELTQLLARYGTPRYLLAHERAALRTAGALAPIQRWLARGPLRLDPPFLAHALAARVRSEARSVLLDADDRALGAHLARRHREGVRVNVNQLGEALLGEEEAERRVAKYAALAQRDDVDALSVKVSSIASQLNLLAFEATTELVAERLARIYRAALRDDGRAGPLVMLDMEAYAHVELTFAALQRALADERVAGVRAGVVLQAYLPDSCGLLRELQTLAQAHVARGGAPLRVRLVKGANLAHERVESAKAGMTVPIYAHKREVDANYKRLLERALTPSSCAALAVGVASHNAFDLAYALMLAAERGVEARVDARERNDVDGLELELLEGMAEPLLRALIAVGARVLAYVPICRDEELNSGIAYLVRRLDENTAPENYLRASFALDADRAALARERERFLAAVELVDQVSEAPRRSGDESFDRTRSRRTAPGPEFRGEPDTDFTRAVNRAWIAEALTRTRNAEAPTLCSIIAGAASAGVKVVAGTDPSRPGSVPYRVALADGAAIERALSCAADDPAGFSRLGLVERAHRLVACAAALREARAELTAAMVLDGGKRVVEADVEVSEAIDFAEYYRASLMRLAREQAIELSPRGVVLVAPPWNFPLAIAAGGIFAALMAGCRVLFKPALETALVGARLAALLHQAGVPREALQLLLCEEDVASALVRDRRVGSTILTGATSTARLFQRLRPGLRLLAETGGKNAYIVTAMSDRELAIRDLVHSAFGHAGQKCSAASLLICEAEVYDDPAFRETLRDAAASLPVGSAWDAQSFVTPLIRPPEGPLARALTTLEPGESWLLEPRVDRENAQLVHPGVKLGVAPDSFTHRTELFGPVLGVMRAESLAHALALANATGYGLTAGLASLDEREQRYFVEHMRAGNLYINRTITGAIVERQPFGGMGKSGFGPGAKAGGPNYVAQLCRVRERNDTEARRLGAGPLPAWLVGRLAVFARALSSEENALLEARARDYAEAFAQHFAREHDPAAILGQFNRFRYLPGERVILRVEVDAAAVDVAASCVAATLTGAGLVVSMDPEAHRLQDASVLGHPLRVERVEALTRRAASAPEALTAPRLRLLGTRSPALDELNAVCGIHIADEPVLSIGRFELLHYVREQSVSIEYHRYGNLGGAR